MSAQPQATLPQATADAAQPGRLAQILERLQRTRLVRTNTHLAQYGGGIYSAGMSFQALFAVFAAVFVGFSVFGFVLRGNPELLAALEAWLAKLLPGVIGASGFVNIRELVDDSALTWAGLISAASLLLLVVNWFTSTRTVIRILHQLDAASEGNPLLLKLKDFGMSLAFGVLLLLSSAVSLAASQLMDFASGLLGADSWLYGGLGWLLRYGIMFAVYWFVVFAIHKWLAALPYTARSLWLGTLPGAVALVVLTLLGSALLGGATKNPLLASFAVLIGLLIWFNLVCKVLLLTASWVATGYDEELGLPPLLLEKDRQAQAAHDAFASAGMAYPGVGFTADDIEPAARWQQRS